MRKSVNMGLLLDFEKAFPGELPLEPEEYLKGGDRNFILKATVYLLGFNSQKSRFSDPKDLLTKIFGPSNKEFANKIYNQVTALQKTADNVEIINVYSSLNLFECFFSIVETDPTQTDEEFERNFFKTYMVLNSKFIKVQLSGLSSTRDIDERLELPMGMFCMQYPLSDKTNYDIYQIWTTQVINILKQIRKLNFF